MMTLTSLNTAAQISLADRMRARGMSCYLTVMAFSMSSGSYLWGLVAESVGIGGAQKIAAASLVAAAAIGFGFSVSASGTPKRNGRS